MKILLLVLSLVMLDHSCKESKINQNTISVEYSEASRGSYKLITINKKMVSVINQRNTKPTNKTCNEEDWTNLMEALKTIEIKNIPNLKAPTEARFYDGAAIANLKIIYNDTTYESQSFDHGSPPKQIEPLVKVILSISENIE